MKAAFYGHGLVLLCSAIFLGSSTLAAAQQSGLDGTYILDETDSDNMNEVIEDAVGKLNFLTPDIAHIGRLEENLTLAYRQVAIHFFSATVISVTVDNHAAAVDTGHRRRGHLSLGLVRTEERRNASMQLAGRRLADTFTSSRRAQKSTITL